MGRLGSMRLRLLAHRARLGVCGVAFLLAVLALAPNASAAPSGCTAHQNGGGGGKASCGFTAGSTMLTFTAKDPAGSTWAIIDETTGVILDAESGSDSNTFAVTQGDFIDVSIGGPGSIKATT